MRQGRLETDQLFFILAITAIVVVLLFFSVQKIYAGNNAATEEDCRQSIRLHSKIIRAGGNAPPISCKINEIEINNRDEAKAKEALAKELAFCWDRWQRGEVELFDMNGGIYCNPCAKITFTEPSRPLSGFTRFLTTARNADGTPYADYLMGYSTTGAAGNVKYDLPDASADTLLTDRPYSVVFVYAKGTSVQTVKENFGNNPRESVKQIGWMTGIGAAAGVIALGVGTGGIGFVVIGAGALIGGTIGGVGEYFFGSAPKPEWVAFTVLQPYDATSLTGLNCTKIEQQGLPKTVNGVENLH